jgi:hypothetical protein
MAMDKASEAMQDALALRTRHPLVDHVSPYAGAPGGVLLDPAVIDVPVAQAWATVRRFDAVAELLPFVSASPIEGDREPTAVGQSRS